VEKKWAKLEEFIVKWRCNPEREKEE